MKDYTFKNAKTANFWASLADVCSNFISFIHDFCTRVDYYPIIKFNNLGKREEGGFQSHVNYRASFRMWLAKLRIKTRSRGKTASLAQSSKIHLKVD